MLINLRNAMMTGKRLPYDAEVEYLESSGTQWIDTGLLCSGADEVAITVYIAANDDRGAWIYFGAGGDARVWVTGGTCRFGGENKVVISDKITHGSWNTIVLNQTQVVVNGTPLSTRIGTFQGTSNLTSWIFRGNGMPSSVAPMLKVASFSWKRNGVLVRDYIPVRNGTVGYLYDRVSGKLFGNAGTGDFVVGQDVVPVEWLQGDGNAYINTGVPCAFTDTYKVVAGYNENTNPSVLFGAAWAERSVFMQMGTSPNDLYWHGMNPSSYHQFADGMNTIVCGNGYITVNGVTTTGSNYLKANEGNEIYLLGNRSFFTGGRPAKARVSNFTITSQGGDDKLRLLSVRVGNGSTWEGAMMDVLTRRIYRNAGTGAFTYGNDLKYPIPAE